MSDETTGAPVTETPALPKVEDLVFDDFYRAKLKGLIGFTVDTEFKWTPKAYREQKIPVEFTPVFTLKSKNGLEIAEQEDSTSYVEVDEGTDKPRVVMTSGKVRVETIKKGLVEVKNFMMEDGTALNFVAKTGNLTSKVKGVETKMGTITVRNFIKYLPATLQVQLQDAINERDTLTPEEERALE